MLLKIFNGQDFAENSHQEGDLYKCLTVFGKTFELRYGYYEDFERVHIAPMPIYPNFLHEPVYTDSGAPFVTEMQDACLHYRGTEQQDRDCGSCSHYQHGEEFLGICKCQENQKPQSATGGEAI